MARGKKEAKISESKEHIIPQKAEGAFQKNSHRFLQRTHLRKKALGAFHPAGSFCAFTLSPRALLGAGLMGFLGPSAHSREGQKRQNLV
jgi:hypothetical protein